MEEEIQKSPLGEAERTMTICNACRYCEGLCATFQAMTLRRAFAETDLDYLANLCHNCMACYHGCQYAPPHHFDMNVPMTLAELRVDTYQRYAWPGFMARLFERNGLVVSLAIAASLSLVLALLFAYQDPTILFSQHTGPGAFYKVIGHNVMAGVAGATFGFSVLALIVGFLQFWNSTTSGTSTKLSIGAWAGALRNTATLKYLGGEQGEGCNTEDERWSNQRRYFHQFTMWGFVLSFASTVVATIYHYGIGAVAPYPVFSLPVLLGSIGGVGLLVGPAGLLWLKSRSDPRPANVSRFGMDYAFLASLFLISLTGMLLLALRETAAMGLLLAVHLGFVLAFFVTLPYSKFVHAIYRFAALLRFAAERHE